MLEHSFYWDFNPSVDPVQKSHFISFIQEKNREIQSQQRIHNQRPDGGNN
jgi:hypothetical protein